MEFFRFIFSSFWSWLGFCVFIYLPLEVIRQVITRIIRSSTVKKAGWPPAHLDADGDFKKEEKNNG